MCTTSCQNPCRNQVRTKLFEQTCSPQADEVAWTQVAVSLILATCISIDVLNRLAGDCSIRLARTCYPQACCMQVVVTTCSKSANVKLQQVCYAQGLMQLDEFNRLAETC